MVDGDWTKIAPLKEQPDNILRIGNCVAKITILAKYWYPFSGGIEDVARSVALRLGQVHDVKVIAFDHGIGACVESIDGITLHRCATAVVASSQPLGLSYIWEILKDDPDLIYLHAPNAVGCVAVLLRTMFRRRRIPIVTLHHMDIFGRPLLRAVVRWLYDAVLHRTSVLIVTSLKNAKISSDIRVPVRVVAIPLGIDLNNYEVGDREREAARAWRRSICGEAPVIAFVGRHARYKGLAILMHALVNLLDVHALIGGDGPYRQRTEELALKLGISDRVHILGSLSHEDKLKLFAAADVFVFPSTEITEAFGVSQLEAMAVGCPVVASDLPTGVTDVSIDDKTALLVPPGDSVGLAAGLRRVIGDRVLAARLAKEARTCLEAKYTIEHMVDRNATLIAQVLADAPHS